MPKSKQISKIASPKFILWASELPIDDLKFREYFILHFTTMTNRIEQLEQFVKEDPGDPFNQYALGLEYSKTDKVKALQLFNSLVEVHPDYLPTYYHLAKLYQDLEDTQHALRVFDLGIDQAKKQNDQKTLRELLGAKQELLFES